MSVLEDTLSGETRIAEDAEAMARKRRNMKKDLQKGFIMIRQPKATFILINKHSVKGPRNKPRRETIKKR